MSRALKQQLKALRLAAGTPRPEWVAANRAILLSQLKNTLHPEAVSFWAMVPRVLGRLFSPEVALRPIAALLTISIAVSGWVATSKASRGALPGDTLYAVKLANEKTQLAWVAMINDKTKAAQLHVELASRRANEVQKIVATHGTKPRVSETVNNVKIELAAATEKLEDIKQQSAASLSPEVISSIKQQTDDIKKSLQQVKIDLQSSSTTEDRLLSEQVADARNLAKDTDVATVQVAVADHLKTNSAISKDYVNALIDTTLARVVVETGETKGNFSELKTIVAEAAHDLSISSTSLPNVSSTIASASSSVVGAASSTASSTVESFKQTLTAVAGETAQTALKTEAAADQIAQKASEVKQLLSVGELSQAASKIQEVSNVSKEVERITDAAIIKVQVSLPEVVRLLPTSSSTSSTAPSTSLLKEKIDSALRSSTVITSSTTLVPTTTLGASMSSSSVTSTVTTSVSASVISASSGMIPSSSSSSSATTSKK